MNDRPTRRVAGPRAGLHLAGCIVLLVAGVSPAAAQADSARAERPRAAGGPPIRRIATAAAVSQQALGAISGVRELPDGRVLLNDGGSRRLLLLDSTLATERVVLDSASELANTYGNQPGALIAHRGDSSIFIDRVSLALLVIDPEGRVARVRSVPRAQDVNRYGSPGSGAASSYTDARGRLVYVIDARPAVPARRPPRGVPYIPPRPDSAFVVALDIETRRLDTIGVLKVPKVEVRVRMSPNGGWSVDQSINPLPLTDDWAVMSDGAIAFVRGIDYRVDFLNADGRWSSSAKVPYDWQPMTDEDKQRLVDSVHTTQLRGTQTAYTSSLIRWVNTYKRKYPPGFTAPDGYVPPNGFLRSWVFPPGVTFPPTYIHGCAPGEEAREIEPGRPDTADRPDPDAPLGPITLGAIPRPPRGRPSCIPQPIPNTARVPDPPVLRSVTVIPARELPDFRPPFGGNSVRADLDGHLWVRTNHGRSLPGGPVYDIVTRQGELIDRLQLPPGYQLVGFGRNRVVYLSMRDARGVHLARVRLR